MKKKLLLGAVSVLAFGAVEANAAGFQLTENSAVGLGRAFAGSGVVGDDLSAIANNPAGMSLFDGNFAVQAGTTLVDLNAPLTGNINGAIPVDTKAASLSAIPQGYGMMKINDKLNLGIGITTPFGLESNYDMDWGSGYGGLFGVRSYIATVDVNPSLSYKATDKISVGVGVSAQYLKAVLTSNNVPGFGYYKVKGDSWAYGYNFGVMYEFNKDNRAGLSYRSKMDHDVEGTTFRSIPGSEIDGTTAGVTLPESIVFSSFHKLNDKFGLSTTARWTKWSRFDELRISNPAIGPDSVTPENWRDTWSVGVGLDYYASDDFTLRFGLGFDKGAVKNPDYRTARIPDSDRIQLGLGASWKYNENITFDFGYMHLFMDDAGINHPASLTPGAPVLNGEFDAYADLFTAAVQIKF